MYNIRKINEHVSVSFLLDSTSNVQSNRSHAFDPPTLNEASNGQPKYIEGRVSERSRHGKGEANLCDVLMT